MPHYKDAANKVHFLDDAAFAHLLPQGSVEISDAEAQALAPALAPMPEPDPIDKLKAFLAANPDVVALVTFDTIAAARASAQGAGQ